MAIEHAEQSNQYWQFKEGLIYDAEEVTLAAKYCDEMAAHRSKKYWVEILDAYFLLEPERDFKLMISSNSASADHMVNCVFTSACGRYAFWRLVNQQAPEAEKKLRLDLKNKGTRRLLAQSPSSKTESAIFGSIEGQSSENSEISGLLKKILDIFSE